MKEFTLLRLWHNQVCNKYNVYKDYSHPQYWKMLGMKCNHLKQVILEQVLVGQKVDDTICWINLYSVGSTEH